MTASGVTLRTCGSDRRVASAESLALTASEFEIQ